MPHLSIVVFTAAYTTVGHISEPLIAFDLLEIDIIDQLTDGEGIILRVAGGPLRARPFWPAADTTIHYHQHRVPRVPRNVICFRVEQPIRNSDQRKKALASWLRTRRENKNSLSRQHHSSACQAVRLTCPSKHRQLS